MTDVTSTPKFPGGTLAPNPTRPRAPRRRGSRLLLTLGVVAGLAGCGQLSDAGSEPEPTVTAADFLITMRDLPEGWADSNSQGLDYRVTVCGVDLEPTPPARATSIRFSQGPVGPFLEEHVRVYDTDVVSSVITGLAEALPGCTAYEASGTFPDSPTARFEVSPLTVKGAPADSVAWRQTTTGPLPVTSDLLLVRRGNVAVMLMAYAIRSTPDPAVLERAVAALPEGP